MSLIDSFTVQVYETLSANNSNNNSNFNNNNRNDNNLNNNSNNSINNYNVNNNTFNGNSNEKLMGSMWNDTQSLKTSVTIVLRKGGAR